MQLQLHAPFMLTALFAISASVLQAFGHKTQSNTTLETKLALSAANNSVQYNQLAGLGIGGKREPNNRWHHENALSDVSLWFRYGRTICVY